MRGLLYTGAHSTLGIKDLNEWTVQDVELNGKFHISSLVKLMKDEMWNFQSRFTVRLRLKWFGMVDSGGESAVVMEEETVIWSALSR